jgi:hypothetical protein
MMLKTKISQSICGKVLTLIAVATLAACGGGGGDEAPAPAAPTAEGVYGGALTGSTSTSFQLVVLENGDFWTLYGMNTPSTFYVAGFIQGNGTSSNGAFTSASAKDFGFAPAKAGTVNATYNASAKTVSGTAGVTGVGSVSFSGGPIPGSTYDYNTAATLSTVAGTWTMTELDGEAILLNIGSSGNFTAIGSSGCNFSGNVTPRPSGKNVFNVALTFGGSPCALPGQSASGIAVAYPTSGGRTQLLVTAVDGSKQYGAAAFGTR